MKRCIFYTIFAACVAASGFFVQIFIAPMNENLYFLIVALENLLFLSVIFGQLCYKNKLSEKKLSVKIFFAVEIIITQAAMLVFDLFTVYRPYEGVLTLLLLGVLILLIPFATSTFPRILMLSTSRDGPSFVFFTIMLTSTSAIWGFIMLGEDSPLIFEFLLLLHFCAIVLCAVLVQRRAKMKIIPSYKQSIANPHRQVILVQIELLFLDIGLGYATIPFKQLENPTKAMLTVLAWLTFDFILRNLAMAASYKLFSRYYRSLPMHSVEEERGAS